MPRIRLVVHLGLHKTGTTSIQQYLTDHPYLLHSAGVLYPGVGRHPLATSQHAVLASAFQDDVQLGGVFALTRPVKRDILAAALREEIEISGCRAAIVSSEEFSRYGEVAVRAFVEAFDEFAIVPVVFLRNFVDLLDAIYASCILYSEYLDEPCAELMRTDLLAPFRAWADAAEGGRLRVVDYDASPTKDSIRDFLEITEILDCELPESGSNPVLNSTVPPYQIALARVMKVAGIDLATVNGLMWQLSDLPAAERQTNLPSELRSDLHECYARLYAELRNAPWVLWRGTADVPPVLEEDRLYVDGLVPGVFALGRALALRL